MCSPTVTSDTYCKPMHIYRLSMRNVLTALLNGLGRQHFKNCQPGGYYSVGAVYVFLTDLCLSFRLLNANKIHCVRVNVFQDLENLSLLSLYDNKIQTLAKGTFAPLKSIQTLYDLFFFSLCRFHIARLYAARHDFIVSFRHLAQNPFVCDCSLKWLADFLRSNPIETSGARCSSPRRLANKRISQIKSKKFRCSGRKHKRIFF